MRSSFRPLLALRYSCLLSLALVTTAARAEPEEASAKARDHFTRGYELAQGGDAASAIREFELAYSLSPNPSVLYNLGQAYAAAGRAADAVTTLERYLELSGSGVSEARALQVKELVEFQSHKVGKLAVDVEPANATVWIDGKAVDGDAHSLLLNAGVHHVLASAPGFELASAEADVPAQGQTTLTFRLKAVSSPVPTPSRTATSPAPPAPRAAFHDPRVEELERRYARTLRVWSYVLGGAALASGTAAAVLYVDNSSRYAAWRESSRAVIASLPDNPRPTQSLDAVLAEANELRRRDDFALGLAVFSGAALAAGAVLFFSSQASEDGIVFSVSTAPELRYVHAF